jgi:hypothetical protein
VAVGSGFYLSVAHHRPKLDGNEQRDVDSTLRMMSGRTLLRE